VHAMVLRPRGVPRRLAYGVAGGVAFRLDNDVGTPVLLISRLNSPACTCPCQRFATALTDADA
jgi:hypothetical protein